jgi:hypothetical protein
MPRSRSLLLASPFVFLSLGPALADPPAVTPVPVEFRVSVADLEQQLLRGIVQKIDPKAKPELPIVIKFNPGDRQAKDAAKEPETPSPGPNKVVVTPAVPVAPPPPPPLVPERRRLFGRPPIGARIIERAVVQPMIDMVANTIAEIPNLDYSIELRSIKLSITGQTLTCEIGAGFHGEGKAVPGRLANPSPVINGDLGIKLTVTKELGWTDSGKIELKEGKTLIRLDPDASPAGFPKLIVDPVVRKAGVPTQLDTALDKLITALLSGAALPDLAKIAPTVSNKLPYVSLAEITAYPLRGDGKDLFVPLVVGLGPSAKKGEEVKVTTKKDAPPEPQFRGKIVFNAEGKPEVKLDPVK